MTGRIQEIFEDELDPKFRYLTLASINPSDSGVPIVCATTTDIKNLPCEESVVRISGLYCPRVSGARQYVGPKLFFKTNDFEVLSSPDSHLDKIEVRESDCTSPSAILALGRRSLTGQVLATWRPNQLLIRSDDSHIHRIELSLGQPLPSCGDKIMAIGNAETDLYHINLSHATCKAVGRAANRKERPESLAPEAILCNEEGKQMIKAEYGGRLIRITGKATLPQAIICDRNHLYLNCGRHIVPVDISSLGDQIPDVPLDSTVEATGICLMDVDNWRPNSTFPKIRGFTLIARSPDDIRIVAKPPWWTPAKFIGVIAVLLAALVVILIWNRSLKFLVNRRSRELLREQISHAGAVLKAEERTRLAVELHDSLSQNLAGVACQIDTTEYAIHEDPPSAADHLTTAKRMLQSCQQELKRCLFDLRCDALNEDDLEDAIRTTLKPVIGSVQLAVRFNVPRNRLLDTTAHALICIIRELASNAVRHGHATKLSVAGGLTDDLLSFSVRDNGTGFDRMTSPGPGEGHFGLQGIRDRVDRLHGVFSMESSTTGTYAKITIHLSNKTAKAL